VTRRLIAAPRNQVDPGSLVEAREPQRVPHWLNFLRLQHTNLHGWVLGVQRHGAGWMGERAASERHRPTASPPGLLLASASPSRRVHPMPGAALEVRIGGPPLPRMTHRDCYSAAMARRTSRRAELDLVHRTPPQVSDLVDGDARRSAIWVSSMPSTRSTGARVQVLDLPHAVDPPGHRPGADTEGGPGSASQREVGMATGRTPRRGGRRSGAGRRERPALPADDASVARWSGRRRRQRRVRRLTGD
jgi:hypothetical protein